jgi:hypothetical protein
MAAQRPCYLGIEVKIGCHTFRATGITADLVSVGTLAGPETKHGDLAC